MKLTCDEMREAWLCTEEYSDKHLFSHFALESAVGSSSFWSAYVLKLECENWIDEMRDVWGEDED